MGPARNLTRTGLLLHEMDASLRRAERERAVSDDPETLSRHFAAHVRSGREPREFFASELEDYHKTHDEWRAAEREYGALSGQRGRAKEKDQSRKRRSAAWTNMEEKGKALAAKAHAVNHPVGQYLDIGHPEARVPTWQVHRALHHVSHDPKVKPPHGYGAGEIAGANHWTNANEASRDHLEHALKAHGFHNKMRRGQRDPHLVITGGSGNG